LAILIALAISTANMESLSFLPSPLFLIIQGARSKTFPRTRYCLYQPAAL